MNEPIDIRAGDLVALAISCAVLAATLLGWLQ